jgi:hypothetical protein
VETTREIRDLGRLHHVPTDNSRPSVKASISVEVKPSAITRQTEQAEPSLALRPASALSSKLMTLTMELAKTCLNRGEEMDEVRLESYSKALAEAFPDDADALAVLDRMGKSRRAEFESKIPSLGDLLGDIRNVRGARLN